MTVNRSALLIRRELDRLRDIIPAQIAHRHVAWLLDWRVLDLHRSGMSRLELSEMLGVNPSVIDRRLQRAEEREGMRSPMERYLADATDILEITAALVPPQGLPSFLRSWARP